MSLHAARPLVVKAGAVAAWATFGGVLYAKHKGAFDGPPPFDRAAFPEPDARPSPSSGPSVTAAISRVFSATASASSRQTCAAARSS